jgi:6,7-dimethyl-8-ribityllumazine synthase
MCDSLEQAYARSGQPGSKEDKGYDAAVAAISMAALMPAKHA